MTNEINRMTKDKAREVLEQEKILSYGSYFFTKWDMHCSSCDLEEGYVCCQGFYESVKEALEDLEHMCDGHWEEVEEL